MKVFSKFPFEDIQAGSKIIVYGAGLVGRDYYFQLQMTGFYELICYCDQLYDKKHDFVTEVIAPETAVQKVYDYVIIASSNDATAESIKETLLALGVDRNKIVYRNCLFDISNYGTEYNSQHHADYIAKHVFDILNISDFRYIEIGANHPIQINNTYLFYSEGKRGIAIDPNPKFKKLWENMRPDDLFLNVGIGKSCGELNFYLCNADGLSTFDKELADNIQEVYQLDSIKIDRTIKVPVITINNVISQYCGGVFPEFMSIDIEGLEYEALLDADLTGNIISVVEIDKSDICAMNRLFEEKGYFAYCRTVGDMIYVRSEYRSAIFNKLKSD